MNSDYEDMGISASDPAIVSIAREALRGRDADFSRLTLSGVIEGLDYNSTDVKVRATSLVKKAEDVTGVKFNPHILTDLFYVAFLRQPVLMESSSFTGSQTHHDIISSFAYSPSIIDATKYSVLSPSVSSGTAITFAASLLEELEKIRENGSKEDSDAAKAAIQCLIQQPQEEDKNGGEKKEAKEDKSSMPVILEAASKATEKARKEAENIDTLDRLAGKQSAAESKTDPDETIELSRNLKVREVLEIANNMARVDIKRITRYVPGKPGQPIDKEYGRDIRRMHPVDAALPEDEFWLRYTEGRLRNIEKGNPEVLGPRYLLVDRSGSMGEGSKSPWSKAVALKLFQDAMAAGADFYMRYFDAIPHELMYSSSKGRSRRIDAIKDICEMAPKGGTDIGLALSTAMEDIVAAGLAGRKGKARPTLILITDGEDEIMDFAALRSRKESHGIDLVSIMIYGKNSNLEAISTRYMEVTRMDAKTGLQVVDAGIRTRTKVK